jgi:hypothetical protein
MILFAELDAHNFEGTRPLLEPESARWIPRRAKWNAARRVKRRVRRSRRRAMPMERAPPIFLGEGVDCADSPAQTLSSNDTLMLLLQNFEMAMHRSRRMLKSDGFLAGSAGRVRETVPVVRID